MTMSVIGATTLQVYPQYTNPARVAGPGFVQSLAVAAGPETNTGAASSATAGVGTPVAEPKPDFTHMTPHELYSTAQTMYNEGKIGLTELFDMQWMSGGFQTNGADKGNETPVNYVDAFKSRMAFIASHGGKGDAAYQTYTSILDAISAGKQGGKRNDA